MRPGLVQRAASGQRGGCLLLSSPGCNEGAGLPQPLDLHSDEPPGEQSLPLSPLPAPSDSPPSLLCHCPPAGGQQRPAHLHFLVVPGLKAQPLLGGSRPFPSWLLGPPLSVCLASTLEAQTWAAPPGAAPALPCPREQLPLWDISPDVPSRVSCPLVPGPALSTRLLCGVPEASMRPAQRDCPGVASE